MNPARPQNKRKGIRHSRMVFKCFQCKKRTHYGFDYRDSEEIIRGTALCVGCSRKIPELLEIINNEEKAEEESKNLF